MQQQLGKHNAPKHHEHHAPGRRRKTHTHTRMGQEIGQNYLKRNLHKKTMPYSVLGRVVARDGQQTRTIGTVRIHTHKPPLITHARDKTRAMVSELQALLGDGKLRPPLPPEKHTVQFRRLSVNGTERSRKSKKQRGGLHKHCD